MFYMLQTTSFIVVEFVRNSLVIKGAKIKTLILLYLQMIEYNEQYHQYTKTHMILTELGLA